jgi:branched-chain amino acid transport system substrate-binding protein
MVRQREDIVAACLVGALLALASPAARAQAPSGEPLKIGYGIAQTGGLAPNGRSALLAQKIWEEDVNAKDGLLGRPVKLVYYDDQSNPATVPAIYEKLLDVDKVDIIIGGYGTNMLASTMPVVIQKQKVLIGLFGLAVNAEFAYPKYFSMIPLGPTPKLAQTKGFLRFSHCAKPEAADNRNRSGRCGIREKCF